MISDTGVDGVTEVTFVGTGTAFPEPHRGPTCTLLRDGGKTLAVDLGSGSLQKLAALETTPLNLDGLVLTHAHLDHIADLLPLLFALHVPGYDRARPLEVFASAGTLAVIERARAAFGKWLDAGESQVCFHAVCPGDTFEVAGFAAEAGAVHHDATSLGLRISTPAGAILAVPGDTGPCEGLVDLCRNADLAVVECSLPDGVPIEGHMTSTGLIDLCRDAAVRRLAVVHRYPAAIVCDVVEELRAGLGSGVVLVPDDGDLVELSAHVTEA